MKKQIKDWRDLVNRIFGSETSKNVAKNRLQFILIHDRANFEPQRMEALKEELAEIISKYMEIDPTQLHIELERDQESVALVANIPIQRLKR